MIPLTQEQLQQLQKGDKLICISMNLSYKDLLVIGEEYTVDFHKDGWVQLKDTRNCYEYHHFSFPDSKQQGVTNMRDEIINLRGSTIEQRRELANLLVDLGETLYNLETLLSGDYKTCVSCQGVWLVNTARISTIGVRPFITKYSAQHTSASIKLATRVVIGDSKERFEKAVNELETEGYSILPETFIINDKRYTILMQLIKPKETPCLQL